MWQHKRTWVHRKQPCVAFSLLFNNELPLELVQPEIGVASWKSILLFGVCSALLTVLENPRELIIYTPSRTDNRIRSPRFAASGH